MTGNRIERALGYVRVSTQRQADGGVSLANQEQKLGEHYRRLGVELVDVYRDGGLSGTNDNRPGLQALFEHALRAGSGIMRAATMTNSTWIACGFWGDWTVNGSSR